MSYKAIALGVVSYLLGYGACLILGSALPGEPYTPQWLLIVALVLLVPAASGALAARIATSRPLGHGALTGFIGTAVSLAILIVGLSVSTTAITVVAWLFGATVLGLLGALVFGQRRLGPNNSFKPKPLRGSA